MTHTRMTEEDFKKKYRRDRMTTKEIITDAFSLKDDSAEHEEIETRFISGGQITGTNMSILVLAIFIASIGLNMNSTAVIIGAMLISPIMGSIQAMGYGISTVDMPLFRKSLIGFVIQIVISLVASTVYFWISPISTQTSELLARTQPTIWDVLIAICGGLAGAIGVTRKEKSNVIPGVAIATALMPPLCTCGYSIANGEWKMFLGAGYLFLVNSYFILFSSVVILLILEVPRKSDVNPRLWKRIRFNIVRNTLFLIIPSIIVAAGMVQSSQEDSSNVTGFASAVSTESVIKQIEILYPEVENVKIQVVEQMEGDQLVEERDVLLHVSQSMSETKKKTLTKWLSVIYDEKCKVIIQ